MEYQECKRGIKMDLARCVWCSTSSRYFDYTTHYTNHSNELLLRSTNMIVCHILDVEVVRLWTERFALYERQVSAGITQHICSIYVRIGLITNFKRPTNRLQWLLLTVISRRSVQRKRNKVHHVISWRSIPTPPSDSGWMAHRFVSALNCMY